MLNILCDVIHDVLLNMFTTDDKVLIFALQIDKRWLREK